MKKLFMLALALGLLLALSVCALAANATSVTLAKADGTGTVTLNSDTPYFVGNAAVNEAGLNGRTWTAHFNSTTATLTLKDAEIGPVADTNGIDANGSLTIELVGTNAVTGGNATGDRSSYGISVTGNLTISGDGSLTATGGEVSSSWLSCGINVDNGGLEILNTTVNAQGGAGRSSFGIRTIKGIEIKNSIVTARGGTGTNESHGIYNSEENIVIRGSSTVEATGGEVTNIRSSGIWANGGNVDISDSSTVNAAGGKATNVSYGIYAGEDENRDPKDIIISGSARVTAQSGAAGESAALCAIGSVTLGPPYDEPANRLVMAGADENSAVEWTGTNTGELNLSYKYVRIFPPEQEQEQEQVQRVVREEKVADNTLVPAERIIEEPPLTEENPNTGMSCPFALLLSLLKLL